MGLGVLLQVGYFLLTFILGVVCVLYLILIYRTYNRKEIKEVLEKDDVYARKRHRRRTVHSKEP